MHIILDKTAASKLYKTLQNFTSAKHTGVQQVPLWTFWGTKSLYIALKNTSSNKVTTPGLMTVLCAVAIEEASK